jgi:biotin carboxylase
MKQTSRRHTDAWIARANSVDSLPRVLVTGAEHHYVVAACRALRRGGFAVTTGASSRPALAHVSRCSDYAIWLPDPHREPEQHVVAISDALRSRQHDVILPGDEASLLALSLNRGVVAGQTRTGLVPIDAVARSLDKVQQLEFAREAGIPSPPTVVCDSESEALGAARRFGYPIVVKPQRSQLATSLGLRHQRSLMADTEHQLVAALPLVGRPFLVQSAVAGGSVFSCSGVLAGGVLRATAFAHYRRTWPRQAGSASYAETLDIPPALCSKIVRFLELVGHEGLFEVELIGANLDDLAFIDLNPRLYGSLALAVTAGANLPAVWSRWMLGETAPPQFAKAGIRYRWEEGEIQNVIDRLRRRRIRETVEILLPQRRVAHALFRLADPRPFVSLSAAFVGHKLRSRP